MAGGSGARPRPCHVKSGAKAAVDALCQPIVDGDWAALPLPREPLGIPEGRVTGGDWRSYES